MIESGPAVAELRERARKVLAERQKQEQAEPTGESPEIADRVPPMPIEPRASRMSLQPVGNKQATPNPQPARPTTPPPQPAKQGTPPPQPNLSEESLFGDLDEKQDRTKVLTQGPRMSMRQLQNVPTDPSRNAARRNQSSSLPIVIAALLALVLGAGGGVFFYSRMASQQPQQASGMGRFSLKTDRPVSVVMMGQALGQTPLESWVPSGSHQVVLKEADGTSRALTLVIESGKPNTLDVTLDELPKLP